MTLEISSSPALRHICICNISLYCSYEPHFIKITLFQHKIIKVELEKKESVYCSEKVYNRPKAFVK